MTISPPTSGLRQLLRPKTIGGLVSLAIASIIYSQFNLYGTLARDSAIYIYGGQRATHGIPPYASIMDPKGPLPGILNGFGVAVARLFGRDAVLATRVEFAAISIVTVLGIYLLVLELWGSVLAAVVAAGVFASFRMFAFDALHGPDGHTPGITLLTFAMWLTVRKQWYLAGLLASFAFYSWQPLFAYPIVVLVCAAVWSPGRRLRAAGRVVAGGATATIALFVYYAVQGFPYNFFEGTFLFPVFGAYRPPVTFSGRLHWIFNDIPRSYGANAYLIWIGLILLAVEAIWTVVAARSSRRAALTGPVFLLLVLSLVVQIGYVLYDYIGWTHSFPLLPYAAVGFGAATARLLHSLPSVQAARHAVAGALMLAVTALTVICAVSYYEPTNNTPLSEQRASSCAIERSLPKGTALWSLDNPLPLVFLHRVNPDNYPYLGSGEAWWRLDHVKGGFDAWTAEIKAKASIVTLQYWREKIPIHAELDKWLSTHGYKLGYIGQYRVYVNHAALVRMKKYSIRLTRKQQPFPLMTKDRVYRNTVCTTVKAG